MRTRLNRWILFITALSAVCLASALPQSQFQEDAIPTSAGDLKIACIGHGTLMFTHGGKVIHVDPVSAYADYSKLPKADVILVTHEHGDHLDAKAIQTVSTDKTTVVASQSCAKALPAAIIMTNGSTRTVSAFRIEAVPAYNVVNSRYHPKGNGNGYVVTFGDKRVYVAGDTENIPEMKELKQIDIAFLPMNLPFTMTPEAVADAVRAFRPEIVYPYHYGSSDTAALVSLLKDEKGIEVRIRELK